MSTLDNGGPAFPVQSYGGMTLRDYFAANALAAVPMRQPDLHDVPQAYERIARHCYKMADAMLAARNEEQQ